MVLERQITDKILTYVRKRGCKVFKISDRFLLSVPDILGCTPDGRLLSLEVKRPKKASKKGAKLQKFHCDEFKKMGAVAAVVNSVEQVEKLFDKEDV